MTSKQAFIQKLEGKLEGWQADMDALKAKMKEADADAKMNLEKRYNDLRIKYKEGENKIKEVANASEDKWESMKSDIDNFWNDMKLSAEKIKSKVLS
jgi:hypothetical protein